VSARQKSLYTVLLLGLDHEVGQHGGSVRYINDLRNALAGRGASVPSVVLGRSAGAPARAVVASGHAAPLVVRLFKYTAAAVRLMKQADVVDSHFALYGFLPALAARLRRTPLIVHFQGPWASESEAMAGRRGLTRVRKLVEGIVYRQAAEVVVLTHAFGTRLSREYGVRPERISVIPPAVDLERFTPGDRRQSRAALGLPDDGWIVVAARRLVPRTGIDVLLRAWSLLAPAERGALVIAADGPEAPSLHELAIRLGVAESVHFLGRVDDELMPDLYRAADVSVVPTRALEGFGLSALESFACGTPVLATTVDGLREALGPFADSCTVPPDDPEQLARLLSSAARGEVPDRAACRTYAETFSLAVLAERHDVVIRRALRQLARRPKVVYVGHSAQLSGG
jgi:glycosyltransferase involved in cell wall biosynthesis